MAAQPSLWQTERQTLLDALDLTALSLTEYGRDNRHWVVAYSGGKDSTATITALDWLIAEEEARIRELIDLGTWPNGWEGDERIGDDPFFISLPAHDEWLFGGTA